MTTKRKDYKGDDLVRLESELNKHKDDDRRHWQQKDVSIITIGWLVTIIGFMILLGLVTSDAHDTKARSILTDLYNFSDGECVASTPTFHCPAGIDYCDPGLMENTPRCTFYCHTTQIPDGETCEVHKNVNVSWVQKWCSKTEVLKGVDSVFGQNGFYICVTAVNGSFELPRTDDLYMNITTCTSTFRTERTFCATSAAIVKVKEAIG